jgi:HK97 gp10 family phage protein
MAITVRELQERLKNLQKETIPAVEKGMQEACNLVVADAKRDCTPGQSRYWKAPYSDDKDPRREPPHMRDTIEGYIVSTETEVSGIVGTWKHYAPYVHEGTSRMPARPFILDNIIDNREEILEILARSLGEVIEKETS